MTFDGILVPDDLQEAVADAAWVEAMLDAEAALARAQAAVGVVPREAAEAISRACGALGFRPDPVEIAAEGRRTANPAEPLVRALRERVGDEAAGHVHHGATSQDIVDTAAMLVARRALRLVRGHLNAVAARCAELAEAHRATPMSGRTLLQQAVPTTFGLVAAGWLVAALDARDALDDAAHAALVVQLGGAAGTLAALGPRALEIVSGFARELGLGEPLLPWHTDRTRIVRLAGALDLVAGALSRIALDVVLLSQTEVGELVGGGGASSTMPHKRNPTGAVRTRAAARQAGGHAAVLRDASEQELQRAAGAWQAEWSALSGALALTGGAAAALAETLGGLQVDAVRMRANLDASHGLVLSERVAFALAERLGRNEAQTLVGQAARRALERGRPLRDELEADPSAGLDAAALDRLFDVASATGAAGVLVERALDRYHSAG